MNQPKHEVKTASEIIGQAAGAVSLCWNPKPAGVFDSTKASRFLVEATDKLTQTIKRERDEYDPESDEVMRIRKEAWNDAIDVVLTALGLSKEANDQTKPRQ